MSDDLRAGLRAPTRSKGFTAVVAVTLGVAIGFNAAMFSTARALLARPLLLDDLDRLVQIQTTPENQENWNTVSPGDFLDWRERTRTLAKMAACSRESVNLSNPDSRSAAEPEHLKGARVTWDFFDTLGVKPILGRAFVTGEDREGASRVVILSQGVWERRFGADPGVLGRSVRGALQRAGLLGG